MEVLIYNLSIVDIKKDATIFSNTKEIYFIAKSYDLGNPTLVYGLYDMNENRSERWKTIIRKKK